MAYIPWKIIQSILITLFIQDILLPVDSDDSLTQPGVSQICWVIRITEVFSNHGNLQDPIQVLEIFMSRGGGKNVHYTGNSCDGVSDKLAGVKWQVGFNIEDL